MHIPIEDVRKNSEDYALLLEWFERVGYDADITGLQREFGFTAKTLEEWARIVDRRPLIVGSGP